MSDILDAYFFLPIDWECFVICFHQLFKVNKSKKPSAEKGSPQTEKAPMQIWFSFKWSKIKVSPHVPSHLVIMKLKGGGGHVQT